MVFESVLVLSKYQKFGFGPDSVRALANRSIEYLSSDRFSMEVCQLTDLNDRSFTTEILATISESIKVAIDRVTFAVIQGHRQRCC